MPSQKVWIDAGHGGNDSGAVGFRNRYEKDDNLTYALELDKQFKAQGLDTVLTRTKDIAVSLNDRTSLERDNKCDLAISCHRNGFNDINANGFEIWLHSNAPQSYIDWGKEIATKIEQLGMRNRGVLKGFRGNSKADYYANSGTNSPSMLIEMGFITNEKDNRTFDTHLQELCKIIVKASCNFLKCDYLEQDKPLPPTQEMVPMGEYKKLLQRAETAEKTLNKIKDLIKEVL